MGAAHVGPLIGNDQALTAAERSTLAAAPSWSMTTLDSTQASGFAFGPMWVGNRDLTVAQRARLMNVATWNWMMLADRVAEVLQIGAGAGINAPGVLTLGGD